MNWIEIDSHQWIWEMGENKYRVVISGWNDKQAVYVLKDKIVDISIFSEEAIEHMIRFAYESFEEMKRIESNWRQMLAVIYVEFEDEEFLLSSKRMEAMRRHFKHHYGLVTRFKDLQKTALFEKLQKRYKEEISDGTLSEEDLKEEGMREDVRKACITYLQFKANESYYRADIYEAEEVLMKHGYLELMKKKK